MSAQATQMDEEQPRLEAMESPGKRLRIARQAKGMSLGDIAGHMHLSQSIIQALENDDYDRLPGPVFVRGYLRNYARLLGLDDQEILSGYGGTHTGSQTPAPVHQGVKPEIRSSHFGVRLVTWIIILGLLGLLGAWWQGYLEWNNGVLDQAMEGEVSAPVSANADASNLTQPQPEPNQAPERLPQISAEPPAENAAEAQAQEPAHSPEEAESSTPQPEMAAAEEEPSQPVAAEEREEIESTSAETGDTTPADAAAAAKNEVVFEFLGPCWVDIRDSTRKFKLFGEMSKGKRKVLEGTPPYSVILGNSAMVRVTVNGQPFDIESLSHGSVARFSLDPSAATSTN